jgi:hypothetical protein
MFKLLIGDFDITNKALVKRTITELWVLQDIHKEEIELARYYSNSEEESLSKIKAIKVKIANTDHDLDILCEVRYGKLERA